MQSQTLSPAGAVPMAVEEQHPSPRATAQPQPWRGTGVAPASSGNARVSAKVPPHVVSRCCKVHYIAAAGLVLRGQLVGALWEDVGCKGKAIICCRRAKVHGPDQPRGNAGVRADCHEAL